MASHRALYPLSSLLTLAIFVSLIGAGWTIARFATTDPDFDGTERVVRDFYAGVNQTVRTGDPGKLETVVAEDAVVHGPLATLAPDSAGLTHYLASLHVTAPHLTLIVAEIVVVGDRARVNLIVQGDENRTFLGSPLDGVAPWGAVDALRIDNGQVAEYWSGESGPDLLESRD
jgi:SnoaL-like polyketide cyclase